MTTRSKTACSIALLAASTLCATSSLGEAQPQQCKGVKQWFQGECRYPEEIDELKKKQAAAHQREVKRAKDRKQCTQAREADTLDAWQAYVSAHPQGSCRAEADARIAKLSAAKPDPTPAPPTPATAPTAAPAPPTAAPAPPSTAAAPPTPAEPPTPEAPAPDATDDGSLSPLVYVGAGLGGAGLITFAVAGSIALARTGEIDPDSCTNNVCPPPTTESDIDSATAAAHAATAGLVATGVGGALVVIGLLVSGSDEAPEMGGLRLSVGPGGASVQGSF